MKHKNSCDLCGQEAVGEVKVTVEALGAVEPDKITSLALVADTCDECRPKLHQKLFDDATKQLERDIPRHKELIVLSAQDAAIALQMKEATLSSEEVGALKERAAVIAKRRSFVADDKNYE